MRQTLDERVRTPARAPSPDGLIESQLQSLQTLVGACQVSNVLADARLFCFPVTRDSFLWEQINVTADAKPFVLVSVCHGLTAVFAPVIDNIDHALSVRRVPYSAWPLDQAIHTWPSAHSQALHNASSRKAAHPKLLVHEYNELLVVNTPGSQHLCSSQRSISCSLMLR